MKNTRRSKSPTEKTDAPRRGRLVHLPLGSLRPDPENPRSHSRQQVRAIARGIEAFGFNAPVLVSGGNRVVAGYGRLEAARLLGLTDVPVVRLEHLTEAQARAYILADNKLADRSSWDETRLARRLAELRSLALDFEIEATGFATAEIDLRIQSLHAPDAMDAADEFDPPSGAAVSRVGDLWLLGPHRLACGDARAISMGCAWWRSARRRRFPPNFPARHLFADGAGRRPRNRRSSR